MDRHNKQDNKLRYNMWARDKHWTRSPFAYFYHSLCIDLATYGYKYRTGLLVAVYEPVFS